LLLDFLESGQALDEHVEEKDQGSEDDGEKQDHAGRLGHRFVFWQGLLEPEKVI